MPTTTQEATRLAPGDPAPDFDLPADDGNRYSKAGLLGTRYVLYFYPKDDTPGCTIEAQDFRDAFADLRDRGVLVLGVSPDPIPSHERFRNKYGLNFPLLSDPDFEAAKAFGAYGVKKRYGRESIGLIRSTFVIGPDGRIERAYYNVRAKGHVDRLKADLG
ncbi:MAG: peroxiredoxin [Deltaproteobacteria bacterium]|nr:MAG: peroxiredoxin [Deltaproteobacteria bacterium]